MLADVVFNECALAVEIYRFVCAHFILGEARQDEEGVQV